MYKIILPFLTLIALVSCNSTKENSAQTGQKKILNTRPVRKVLPADSINYANLDPNVKKYIIKLDSTYNRTPYYCALKDQYIFYVCKGDWEKSKNGSFKDQDNFLGIVNQNYEVLLAPEYSKLYNPDATADSYIEIEKNTKKGLYNYLTGKIIEPQFDVIFPSHLSGYIAFGKAGDEYFSITEAGVEPYTGEIPTYRVQKWDFDIHSDKLFYLHDSYIDHRDQEGTGVVFTPSYLAQLNILPEIVEYINSADDEERGLAATEAKVENVETYSDKFFALFTSFYEEGVDGRGWQINEKSLVIVDDQNNVLGTQKIMTVPDRNSSYFCGEYYNEYHYLGDGMIEVVQMNSYLQQDDVPYDYMTLYTYYQITDKGAIEQLNSNRFFDFTKYVEVKDEHLRGCFSYMIDPPLTEGNMYVSDHLSIEDLDLMCNEIYAEYGLIFKTEKWKKYFSSKSWYKPQYENVDQLLSETDKANLKFINSVREKMRGKEKEYTNKRLFGYAAAG